MVKAVAEPTNLDDLSKFLLPVAAGSFVFHEGDPGADMYIIQEGRVEILKQYAGEARSVGILEVGDFFGEMSLLEEQPREVAARALTDCRLLRLDASTFDQIIREDPEIPVRMLRKLSHRLKEWQDADQRAANIALGPLRGVIEPAAAPAHPAASHAAAPAAEAAQPAGAPGAAPPAPAAPAAAQGPAPSPAGPTPVAAPQPPAAPRVAVLVERSSGVEFPLADRPETTVGRVDRATGFTPGADMSSVDPKRTLSRRHAKIVRREGDYFVREEIGTRNGTFVNGARIPTGTDVKLSDGDQVRFGLVETTFQYR